MQVTSPSSPPSQVLSVLVPKDTHYLSIVQPTVKFYIQKQFGIVQSLQTTELLWDNYTRYYMYFPFHVMRGCKTSERKWRGRNWNVWDTNSNWPTFECDLCTPSYCIRNFSCAREVDISEDWFVLSTLILSEIFDGERWCMITIWGSPAPKHEYACITSMFAFRSGEAWEQG